MIARRAAALVLAALPTLAGAQIGSQRNARLEGRSDGLAAGRLSGREDGSDLGRAQVLVEAYIDGYRRAVSAPLHAEFLAPVDDAEEDGRLDGRPAGLAIGLAAGHDRGATAAADGYAVLDGRPAFRSQAPPPRPDAPAPPPFDACEPPASSRLRLPRGRTVDLDAADLEQGRAPFSLRVPPPPFPSNSRLRALARDEGWSLGEDVDAWVEEYRSGFEETYVAVFEEERRNVAWGTRRDYEHEGAAAGRREAVRRRACAAYARGHRHGFGEGFDEGFERGCREGWDAAARRHEDGPVIVIERARWIDANDDAVFEPGERVTLEVDIANAGMIDSTHAVLEWSGARSIAGGGRIEAPLAAQRRRSHRLDVGALDAAAPLGATATLELSPLRGERRALSALVGRPAIIDGVIAFLDVRDDSLVLVARAVVSCVATRVVERDLRLSSGPATADVGSLEPGSATDVALVLPASGADLARSVAGDVQLHGDGSPWMSRRFEATTGMERAVGLVAALPRGGVDQAEGLAAVAHRLAAEFDDALEDSRLYKRLDAASELELFGAALRGLPKGDATPLLEAVARPLLARAEGRGIPRRVRNAVREALGVRD